MSFFRPTGTRCFIKRLVEASRTASPRRVGIRPVVFREQELAEAEAVTLARSAAGPAVPSEASAATSSKAEPSHPFSSPPPNVSLVPSSLLKTPAHRPIKLSTTLSGDVRPREQHRRHSPAQGARPSHLPLLNRVDPRGAARGARPTQDTKIVEPEGAKDKPWQRGIESGTWTLSRTAKKKLRRQEKKARKALDALKAHAVTKEQHVVANTSPEAQLSAVPSPPSRPLPVRPIDPDFERALFAASPSSLSSVRLTDPVPRAHFARVFAAEREAALAEQVLGTHPRGAASVDLGAPPVAATSAASTASASVAHRVKSAAPGAQSLGGGPLAEQVFASFPRGATSVDLGPSRAMSAGPSECLVKDVPRAVQDVGLKMPVSVARPFGALEAVATSASTAGPRVEPAAISVIEPVVHVDHEVLEGCAAPVVAGRAVAAEKPSPTPSPAHASALARPDTPVVATTPSPALVSYPRPSLLTRRDMRARDPREPTYPVGLRHILPTSPLDRRVSLTAARAWRDLGLHRDAQRIARLIETVPSFDEALWLAEVREVDAQPPRLRAVEDRCLEGEMARGEEQRLGRQLEALHSARTDIEALADAYRSYRDAGLYVFPLERRLAEWARRVEGLLSRALVGPNQLGLDSTTRVAVATADKAILWASDWPFFVEWPAYIAAYPYRSSRSLKELEVMVRREERRVGRAVDQLQEVAMGR